MDLTAGLNRLWTPPAGRKALAPQAVRDIEPHIFSQANTTSLAIRSAFTHLSAYAGDDAIDWVFDCVNLIAEALAGADYHFEQAGKTLVTELTDANNADDVSEAPADLSALFRQPNPYATWGDLLTLLVIDWLLIGNAFWLRFKGDNEGKPAALYRLMPQYLEIIPGKTRLVDGFKYNVPGATPTIFKPEDVIHFRRPNPHSEYLGTGVVKGGARVFDLELGLTRSQAEYFEQGTRLSGVLESDRGVPQSVWTKIKRQFAALYAGPGNSYKVAMLSHGLKFKPIQASAAEAEFRFLTEVSRDRILAMFRVPPPLLGITGGFDRQAVREAQRIFDNKTVRPIADQLQAVITLALTSAWGVDFKIDYEYEMPIEDKLELAVDVATLPGITVGEVREAAGYRRLGPDKKDPESGEPIDDLVLNLPGSSANNSEVKDRPLGDEPGRPPNPENTETFPQAPNGRMPRDAQVVRAAKAFRDVKQTLDRLERKVDRVGAEA